MIVSKMYFVLEVIKVFIYFIVEVYVEMYMCFVEEFEVFWVESVSMLEWYKMLEIIKNMYFGKDDVFIKWFEDGQLNVSYNCIDRYLVDNVKKVVFYWEGDELSDSLDVIY